MKKFFDKYELEFALLFIASLVVAPMIHLAKGVS